MQSRQFEREPFDFKKGFGQTRCVGIKAGARMLQHSIASGVDPRRQMTLEEGALLLHMRNGRVVAGNQVAHDLAQGGEVVFGFGDAFRAFQTVAAKVITQHHQRLLVEETGLVVRAIQEHLRLGHQ